MTERRPGPVNLDAAHAAIADVELLLERFAALLEKHHVAAAVLLPLA